MLQNQLALRAGLPTDVLNKIEHDRRRVTLDEAGAIAVALGVSIDELLAPATPTEAA